MIAVGDTAPDFSLPATWVAEALPSSPGTESALPAERTITLSQYLHKIDVLLLFYPLDWSPVCSSEHARCVRMFPAYSSRIQVLGISVDSIFSHRAFASHYQIPYPLLADFQPRGDVARRYDVYLEEYGFAARTAFLVDREGKIRSVERAAVPDARKLDALVASAHPA